MKKFTKKTLQRKRLALRPETIASLTPSQLSQVAGGVPEVSQLKGCVIDTLQR